IFKRTEGAPSVPERLNFVDQVGMKACGLALLPDVWTPPFVVVSTALYLRWRETALALRSELLMRVLGRLEGCATAWSGRWPAGIAFRSSASSETLRDRGAYRSLELAADYGIDQICDAIGCIYSN